MDLTFRFKFALKPALNQQKGLDASDRRSTISFKMDFFPVCVQKQRTNDKENEKMM